MAKLYWRIKKNDGNWTYIPAIYDLHRGEEQHKLGEKVTLWWPSDYEYNTEEE